MQTPPHSAPRYARLNLIRLLCALLAAQFLPLALLSAGDEIISFQSLTIEQGLSQNAVYNIVQDHSGFIWVGTQDGLNRYDGYQFKVFKTDVADPRSLSHNYVRCLTEDRDGFLWVGTEGGGLNRFDPKTGYFQRFLHDPERPESLAANRVAWLLEDRQGRLWIGTTGGGLDRFDAAAESFIHYPGGDGSTGLPDDRVWTILEDKAGSIWVGTRKGLSRLDEATETWQHFPGPPHLDEPIIAWSLAEDQDGLFWLGSWGQGLFCFDPKTNRYIHQFRHNADDPQSLGDDIAISVFVGPANDIWVGTLGGGLCHLDPETGAFKRYTNSGRDPHSLSHNRVYAIFRDRGNLLWVGTGRGLNKGNLLNRTFLHYRRDLGDGNRLSDNHVLALCEGPAGEIWAGYETGGLAIFEPISGSLRNGREGLDPKLFADDVAITAILRDRDNNMWLGTDFMGLAVLDGETGKMSSFRSIAGDTQSLSRDRISALYESSDGSFWVGTNGGGLDRLDRTNYHFQHFRNQPGDPTSLSNNAVHTILETRDGYLWVGTQEGLNRLDRSTGKFTVFRYNPNEATSLSNNLIQGLYEDDAGRLWIGTLGGGLNCFDPDTQKFARYSERSGLTNNVIYGILPGEPHQFWLSSNRGLSRVVIDPAVYFPPQLQFRHYDVEDGLQSNEFNIGAYCKTRRGELYFGGINGFNRLSPASVREKAFVAPLALTSFRKANREFEIYQRPGELLAFDILPKDEPISFQFAALDFSAPAKNRYAYSLSNQPGEWIDLGSRHELTFAHLEAGKVLLKIKGSNSEGVWNEDQVLAIQLNVIPPIWRTWWAYLAYILSFTFLLIAVPRYRINHLKKLQFQLESQVSKRTAELVERNKELETLDDIVRALNLEVDLDRLLQCLLEKGMVLIPQTQKSSLIIRDPETDRFHFKLLIGYDAADFADMSLTRSEVIKRYIEGVTQLGEGLHLVKEPPPLAGLPPHLQPRAPKSILAIALVLENRLEGVLLFSSLTNLHAFDQADVEKLARFRKHTLSALAKVLMLRALRDKNREIEKAREELLSKDKALMLDLEMARKVQVSLLPIDLPRIAGLEIAGYSKPTKEVGGDYYDCQALGPSRLGVVIGDVSGKGMPAAMYTAMIKGLLQVHTDHHSTPAHLLKLLNHNFYQTASRQIFVSLLFALFDVERMAMTFASAGHPPVIYRDQQKKRTIQLKSEGMAIGLESGELFNELIEEQVRPLNWGDTFVFYTDGLTEERNEHNEEFGIDGLIETIASGDGLDARGLLAHIRARYEAFVGQADQQDDLSLVVIRLVSA